MSPFNYSYVKHYSSILLNGDDDGGDHDDDDNDNNLPNQRHTLMVKS